MPRPSKGPRHAVKVPLAQPVHHRMLDLRDEAGCADLGPFIADMCACAMGMRELCPEISDGVLPLTLDTRPAKLIAVPPRSRIAHTDSPTHNVMVRLPVPVYDRILQHAHNVGAPNLGPFIADLCALHTSLPHLTRGPLGQDPLPLTLRSVQEAIPMSA